MCLEEDRASSRAHPSLPTTHLCVVRHGCDDGGPLAGHPFEESVPIASARGFRVVRVGIWPGWWPRLPLLDSRITIELAPPVAAGSR